MSKRKRINRPWAPNKPTYNTPTKTMKTENTSASESEHINIRKQSIEIEEDMEKNREEMQTNTVPTIELEAEETPNHNMEIKENLTPGKDPVIEIIPIIKGLEGQNINSKIINQIFQIVIQAANHTQTMKKELVEITEKYKESDKENDELIVNYNQLNEKYNVLFDKHNNFKKETNERQIKDDDDYNNLVDECDKKTKEWSERGIKYNELLARHRKSCQDGMALENQVQELKDEVNQWQTKTLELEENLEKQTAQTTCADTTNKEDKITQTMEQQPSNRISTRAEPKKNNNKIDYKKNKSPPKREENIMIIKGDQIFEKIKDKIKSNELGFNPKKFLKTKMGHTFVATNKKEELNIIKEIIQQRIPEATINPQIKRTPRIEIKSVPSAITEETISDYLSKQNREFEKQSHKVITSKMMANNKKSFILEISPKILGDIKDKKTLWIDWDQCPFKEIWHINRCGKCLEFTHFTKNCPKTIRCHKCGENHTPKECQNNKKNCCICSDHNQKFKTRLNTDHSALHNNKCTVLAKKIQKQKNITEYSVMEEPEIEIVMDTI